MVQVPVRQRRALTISPGRLLSEVNFAFALLEPAIEASRTRATPKGK